MAPEDPDPMAQIAIMEKINKMEIKLAQCLVVPHVQGGTQVGV